MAKLVGMPQNKHDLIQERIDKAKEIEMLLLHHDAITGTHTLEVKADYEKKAFQAF